MMKASVLNSATLSRGYLTKHGGDIQNELCNLSELTAVLTLQSVAFPSSYRHIAAVLRHPETAPRRFDSSSTSSEWLFESL